VKRRCKRVSYILTDSSRSENSIYCLTVSAFLTAFESLYIPTVFMFHFNNSYKGLRCLLVALLRPEFARFLLKDLDCAIVKVREADLFDGGASLIVA